MFFHSFFLPIFLPRPQVVEVIEDRSRDSRLHELLQRYHASRTNRVIVFVLYKKEAARVEAFLQRKGWKVRRSCTPPFVLFLSGPPCRLCC
jgi:hypothetical protein